MNLKKTWKKLICCVCVIMMFGLLTACGTTKRENVNEVEQPVGEITTEEITTEEVDEPIVITVLTDKTQLVDTKFAEYKAKFEAEQENVLVEFEAVLNYEDEMFC